MQCSVVIPIHNEAEHLGLFLNQFFSHLGADLSMVSEVLLMENGSQDNTWQVCQDLQSSHPALVRAIQLTAPSYGEAIKQGMLESSSDACCILEVDFLDNLFVRDSLAMLEHDQADFVVASKRHPDSLDERPLTRRLITWAFNLFLKIAFRFKGSDTHGLKMIRTPLAKELCSQTITSSEVLQTELVLLADRFGYRIAELPITIRENRAPSVSIPKRVPKVLRVMQELRKSLNRFPRQSR